jgi:hypothetical protein
MAVSLLKMRIFLTWRFLSSFSTWRLTNKSLSICGSRSARWARTTRRARRVLEEGEDGRAGDGVGLAAEAAISCWMWGLARRQEALMRAVVREQWG